MQASELYLDLQTQWRLGSKGQLIGLDYSAVNSLMDLRQVRRKDKARLFGEVQAMEYATLTAIADNQKQQQQQ